MSWPSTQRVSVCEERGLAYCPAKRPSLMTGCFEPWDENEGHLEEDFEFACGGVSVAVFETFCAVAALEEEALALLGLGDFCFESFDFP